MFKCLDCKSEFEEPECGTITHWEVDTRREETSCVCPVCGGNDFEPMKLCPSCNTHWIMSSEDFCKTCITVANLYVNQIQIDNGADWEQTIKVIDYVIEHGGK